MKSMKITPKRPVQKSGYTSSVWAVLKRGYHGTYHHFSKKHIDRYVNEFTFRLNEGDCQIDTIDRIKSLVSGAKHKTLTYKELIA